MAIELHRLIVGAEVEAIVTREQNRASQGLSESQRPQSLKAERQRLASLAIKEVRFGFFLVVCCCRASLPGESAEVVVCRWIEPLPVSGRDDCSEAAKGGSNPEWVHAVLRRTG